MFILHEESSSVFCKKINMYYINELLVIYAKSIFVLKERLPVIKLAYLKEKDNLKAIPKEAQDTILGILQILDSEYGKDRNFKDDGGYVIVVEKEADFEEIKRTAYIDCEDVIPEYVDKILCSNGKAYTNSLILCNNDYAISLIIPMEITPQNLKDYMID
jgi:hypothetical protein